MTKLRAVEYRRVSTEEQAEEGLSLESQDQRNRAFCRAQGWDLVGDYSDDSTGLDVRRIGYQTMVGDEEKYDVIVTIKRDRLHRSVDNARAFTKWAIQNQKQVWSISDGRLDEKKGAAAWFAEHVQQGLPELESRQISERVLPSMDLAKQKGLHQGRPPAGFVWVKKLKQFQPTPWAQKLRDDAELCGATEAGRLNPYPEGQRKGLPVSRSAVYRTIKNLSEYERGTLLPNRHRTPMGTWSKFKEDVAPI